MSEELREILFQGIDMMFENDRYPKGIIPAEFGAEIRAAFRPDSLQMSLQHMYDIGGRESLERILDAILADDVEDRDEYIEAGVKALEEAVQ